MFGIRTDALEPWVEEAKEKALWVWQIVAGDGREGDLDRFVGRRENQAFLFLFGN